MDQTWKDLVNAERLQAWLDSEGLGDGPLENLRPLGGGTQNILVSFERSGQAYVLRRPPLHPNSDGTETMKREARILEALAQEDVPHPRFVATCSDTSVLGAAFVITRRVDGFNATEGLPPLHRADPAIRRRMGLAMVDGLVALGRVDHVTVGLADVGRVEGFLERQVGRWRRVLDSYIAYESWPGVEGLPGVDAVAAWLEQHRPLSFAPGIMHGDFHLANVMFQPDGPELAAIVDWEMATIGDPLIDLGWLLATWPDRSGAAHTGPTVAPWDGFPSGDELVARYAETSTRSVADIDWYRVLACYKLGILLEGTFARSCAGKASKDIGQTLHDNAVRLLARANSLVESG
ncbi:phosphotransferase family protein [Terricaulis silvestris]|uniref:phosphotransferase family protein n=1 Tax=Terricaulis silvestris TaxID=2686094 RepID=UPI001E34896D|nr:phosphotransferase family protein [Terricaulis silvestris]